MHFNVLPNLNSVPGDNAAWTSTSALLKLHFQSISQGRGNISITRNRVLVHRYLLPCVPARSVLACMEVSFVVWEETVRPSVFLSHRSIDWILLFCVTLLEKHEQPFWGNQVKSSMSYIDIQLFFFFWLQYNTTILLRQFIVRFCSVSYNLLAFPCENSSASLYVLLFLDFSNVKFWFDM